MQFCFENFRTFQNSGQIDLLPLNLLIGENSAGKTSFLAGCRLLVEMMRGSATASFNKDPFFLGAFDQIAHFRGGKGGRAQTFVLNAEAEVRMGLFGRHLQDEGNELRNCRLAITFQNKYSQPSIKSISFSNGLCSIEYNCDNTIVINTDNREIMISEEKVAEYENITFPAETPLFSITLMRRIIMISRSIIAGPTRSIKTRDLVTTRKLRDLEGYITGFRSYYTKKVFASAPVRTRPDRIYTPTEITPSPEGNHMPNALARLKRFSPEDWADLKKQLEAFGISSGLFKSIDLKTLGNSGSDPFQLMVSNGGPQRNLMDVGYGVSQSIPIISEVLSSKAPTLFLFQQPEVHLHPRAQAALGTFFAENAASKKGNITVVETHSDNLIDRVKYEIRAGRLDHKSAQILYFSRAKLDSSISIIKFSKSGELLNVPKGYREFFLEEVRRNFS